ncbi:CGNR zinc finger domain-containing protein [Microbacterium atlanticum]|uniref:CGNR zinc finger domain-containing protein n=1 Tax=Microbacterium atlanticum TaxID=2782168 RepID=UPI001888AD36|nr:CGNR zinc finger domain-containing protein [Microbacterium atlanticum]
MLFDNDARAAFGVITDLLNTSAQRSGGSEDLLEHSATIDQIAVRNALSYKPEHSRAEEVEVRLLRSRLEDFLRHPSVDARIALVNSLLVSAGSTPQLAAHSGDERPHFHYTMDDATFSSKLTALTGIGLARLLTTQGEDRFRICDGQDCEKTFIDVSKNASRRYCDSQTCGNRLHAARYRARRGEQSA